MLDGETSAPRILAILLGARTFPNAPKLTGGRAFLNSALDIEEYFSDEHGLGIPPQNILSLFDDSRSPSEQLVEVARFLDTRSQALKQEGARAEDLLIYYVGHGLFTRGDAAYCLAVRCTNAIDEGATSIRAGQLAGIVMRNAPFMRRYLILDCCFAASIHKEFQSGELNAATRQIEGEFPARLGTSLLCSSSARDVSLAPQGVSHTMFSSALIHALRNGHEAYGPRFSFSQLGDLVNEILRQDYPDRYVRPEVHSPDQREGDIAVNPIFPNPSYRRRSTLHHTQQDAFAPGKPPFQETQLRADVESDSKMRRERSARKTGQEGYDNQKWRRLAILTSSALAATLLLGLSYWTTHKSPPTAVPANQSVPATQIQSSESRPSGADGNKPTVDTEMNRRTVKNENVLKKKSNASGVLPSQASVPWIHPPDDGYSKTDNNRKGKSGPAVETTTNQADASVRLLLPHNLSTKTKGTWTMLHTGTSKWLLSMAFATPQLGSAVGWYGAMVHTEDGGASWTEQDIGFEQALSSVTFATASLGFAVGGAGIILRTEDGGRTWSRQNSGTSENLGSVAFVSDQSGFVVGGHGIILHTSDSGRTWSKQNSGTDVGLTSVVFATRLSGWTVGNDGTMLHTEDAGASWVAQHTGVGELMLSVSFATAQIGWTVGQNGVILHTEDGGHSWIRQNWGGTKELHSVAFATNQSAFAVGEGGIILRTEDGGTSWTKENSNTSTELFGALATPQARWATGRDGILLCWK